MRVNFWKLWFFSSMHTV